MDSQQTVKFSELCHFSPKQKEFEQAVNNYKYVLYGGAMGGGKIVSNNGVVLTPFGFKVGIDLKVNDTICNPDGSSQKIIAITPEMKLEKYIVHFDDDTKTEVASGHLWKVWETQGTRKKINKQICGEDSAEIMETWKIKEQIEKGRKLVIPVCGEQHFNKPNRYDIDPYLLGLLLGDGCITSCIMLTCGKEDWPYYISTFDKLDYRIQPRRDSTYQIYLRGKSFKQTKDTLKKLQLLGTKSDTKFIPEAYKWDTIENRYRLVQGLMDTDGYAAKDKCAVYYDTTSERLANDLAFVIRSLGGYVKITTKIGSYTKDNKKVICKKVYRLYIKHRNPEKIFSLKRKVDRTIGNSIMFKAISRIEVLGEVVGRCITVSNPNGLYITNDFIVTHNSYGLRWILIKLAIRYAMQTGLKGITVALFCEDYPSLEDRHISKIRYEFPAWIGNYNSKTHNFTLNDEYGGGVIAFRNLDDVSKYQSAEFAVIAVDELTKNTYDTFMWLRTRLRWPGIKNTKFIAASNPGQIGHLWVKQLWIDRYFPKEEVEAEQFHFVRATAQDNPFLDPSYVKSLESLPEKKRRAFLDGDWDAMEGQFFTEFDREKHVIIPFTVPAGWKKFRSIDVSGRNGWTSCSWYALDYDGNVFKYREYYMTGKDADEHAKMIKQMSNDETYSYTVIDNSAFSKIGMPESIAEVYARCGIDNLVPSSKDRVPGWNFVHQYLRWDDKNEPKLKIFDTCKNTIRTLPILISDENNPEDIDSRSEDHIADDLRYFLQTLREGKTMESKRNIEEYLNKKNSQNNSFNFEYK